MLHLINCFVNCLLLLLLDFHCSLSTMDLLGLSDEILCIICKNLCFVDQLSVMATCPRLDLIVSDFLGIDWTYACDVEPGPSVVSALHCAVRTKSSEMKEF